MRLSLHYILKFLYLRCTHNFFEITFFIITYTLLVPQTKASFISSHHHLCGAAPALYPSLFVVPGMPLLNHSHLSQSLR